MKVKELIGLLSKVDPESRVIYSYESDYDDEYAELEPDDCYDNPDDHEFHLVTSFAMARCL